MSLTGDTLPYVTDLTVTGETLDYPIQWKGNYSSIVAYVTNQIVYYNGSSYINILNCIGKIPTNTTYWSLVVQAGSYTSSTPLQWLGVYASATAYVVNNIVYYNGSSYICVLASVGNLPTNTTYWSLFSSKGDAGQTGQWQSTWMTARNYVSNDLVQYNGSTYICTAGNMNIVPTNTLYWNLVASKGAGGTRFRGTYTEVLTYDIDDIAYYNGSSYICISPCLNVAPTDVTKWQLFASKGSDGSNGSNGSGSSEDKSILEATAVLAVFGFITSVLGVIFGVVKPPVTLGTYIDDKFDALNKEGGEIYNLKARVSTLEAKVSALETKTAYQSVSGGQTYFTSNIVANGSNILLVDLFNVTQTTLYWGGGIQTTKNIVTDINLISTAGGVYANKIGISTGGINGNIIKNIGNDVYLGDTLDSKVYIRGQIITDSGVSTPNFEPFYATI